MKNSIHGFSSDEVMDLYHYLCIYEKELAKIESQVNLINKYPKLKDIEQLMAGIVCNFCTKESLKVIGLVPMDNLISMTKSRSSKSLSFLNHLRNSIAHGQIEKDGNFIYLLDYGYDKDNSKVFSARGMIKSSSLFKIVKLINNNINLL